MRWIPAALVLASLTACLQAVDVNGPGDGALPPDDGSHYLGPDGALPGPDASSPRPDAGSFKSDGGPQGCASDFDCLLGEVCQEVSCGQPKQCVAGCRTSADCTPGNLCGAMTMPKCGEPYGSCAPSKGCTADSQCPAGAICDFVEGQMARVCQAGCHDDAQCGTGKKCAYSPCKACGTCPCFGQCVVTAACTTDQDCPEGTVCGTTLGDCSRRCVPGCHDSSQCRVGQICPGPQACSACGCDHQQCQPAGCKGDAECAADEVCEPGPGCTEPKACVKGCHPGGKPCPTGQVCQTQACLTCPCPGTCESATCAMHQPACSDTRNCSWNSTFCSGGCCQQCPVFDMAPCPDGQTMFPDGVGMDGCAHGWTCHAPCSCPDLYAPVCGENYQTYGNSCEAGCIGVKVLHAGECLEFEGMQCVFGNPSSCPADQYCRDACPMCDSPVMRCTKKGACVFDGDCPAGMPPPSCHNPTYTCSASTHTCTPKCP